MTEAHVQSLVRLEAPRLDLRLWRNNVGVLDDEHGRPVRYGLANDSKALNQVLKSSDLIGWRSVTVTPDMVGARIAQVVTVECKSEGWTGPPRTPREQAQAAWIKLVVDAGGVGGFVASVADLQALVASPLSR